MGKVYLGEDTRLGRKVAIKVLPEQFASIPERLARFEQEARAAAALNHPHIAVIHDIGFEPPAESAGEAAGAAATGTHYMVQEHLEGQTLRDAVGKGRLPLTQALELATEIAEALTAAHEAGIVHRDLKPDNIFVSKEGHAKVLDFGLAKLVEMDTPAPSGGGSGETATAMAQGSPTPSLMGTAAGQVMGTAGYMAPEQVSGEAVDSRADVFAFGCVLFELASGQQPFAGRSMLQTLDKIVHDEPPALEQINDELPVRLQWILEKCLAKEPRGRYQHADDLAVDLRTLRGEVESGTAASLAGSPAGVGTEGPAGPGASAAAGAAAFTGSTRVAALVLVVLALAIGGLAGSRLAAPGVAGGGPTMRFSIELPADLSLTSAGRVQLAVSRDGLSLVFVANEQLWLRSLDEEAVTPIRGTEDGGRAPFFSPDGREIGFWVDDQLKRVSIDGGTPTTLTPAVNTYGAYWNDDGTILYGQGPGGIWRVSENGGDPEQIVALDDGESAQHPWPLPGGEYLLFALKPTGVGPWDDADIVVQAFDTGDRTVVHSGGSDPRYLPSGHLLFGREGVLWAIPFDADTRLTSGGATPAVEDVRPSPLGAATGAIQWALSEDGTLVHLPGGTAGGNELLAWVDTDGTVEPIVTRSDADEPRVSPDGRYIAVEGSTSDAEGVWIIDATRSDASLLTAAGGGFSPAWAPDGEHVYFLSERDGLGIWKRRADFSQPAEHVWSIDAASGYLSSIAADGQNLLYTTTAGSGLGGGDIWLLELGDEPAATEILASADYTHGVAVFHPTGRWIAYDSTASGGREIYVHEIADDGTLGARTTISTSGGMEPAWSRDGATLFYIDPPALMAVDVQIEPSFQPSRPRTVAANFAAGGAFGGTVEYDVANDGRFLITTLAGANLATDPAAPDASPRTLIKVIVNWFEELQERVPTGR